MYPLFCALAEALAGIKEPWWESIKAGERVYLMETGELGQEDAPGDCQHLVIEWSDWMGGISEVAEAGD